MAEALSDFCECNVLSSLPKLSKARTTCPDLGSNLEAGSAKRREVEDARKRKDILYLPLFPKSISEMLGFSFRRLREERDRSG